MARQWLSSSGTFIDEDGEEEYLIPGDGFIAEDQPAAGSWEMIPPWLKHRRIAMHRL